MVNAHAIEGITAFFLLAALIYGPWQWVCTDYARQRIFKKRDVLFDLARAGSLDFSSPVYIAVRADMNRMIRFAHELTWIRLIAYATIAAHPSSRHEPASDRVKSINDRHVRERVRRLVMDVNLTMVIMLLAKSPILMVLFVGTVIPVVAFFFAKEFLQHLGEEIGKLIQSEADYFHS